MIFVANVLVMNGGTTFLIRTCRELNSRGTKCAVILLRADYDARLLRELEKYAAVLCLDQFLIDRGIIFRAHLSVFGFVDWVALKFALLPFCGQIHAMGILGLIFALRLSRRKVSERVTVGVYHQNEFLYRAPPFFFAQEAIRLFASMPANNIVFFNESTRKNYEHFFRRDYAASTMVPIGIDSYKIMKNLKATTDPWRIVSVGNLVKFKTYNAHIIRIVSQLKVRFPGIYYDIYGTGSEEMILRALVMELGVDDRVHFKGAIPYSDLHQAIANAVLFAGSGTALIEAAAAGIPALVGIESITTPESYGFLSDIKGLSYNENIPGIPKQMMLPLVERILGEPAFRSSVSESCSAKATEFSVVTTVDGFLALEQTAQPVVHRVHWLKLSRMLVSLLALALFSRLGYVIPFNDRRNQSY